MRIIVTGGGTGGHVYPALSIIEALKDKDPAIEVLYVGTEKGIESRIVRQANIPFKTLDVQGLNRKISFDTLRGIYKLVKSLFSADKLIKQYKPTFVLGTGGYVSFPILFVAGIRKIPVYIHEQNAYPGVANKLLSKKAKCLFISFPESIDYFNISKEKIFLSGNPVRNLFNHIDKEACRNKMGLASGEKLVLAFGGSGGARKINDLVIRIAKEFTSNKNIKFIHATGERYFDEINQMKDLPENLDVRKYIDDMPSIMGASDLMIGRSGAITLAEISTLGIPAVLVPSPNVANDHQMMNAKAFERSKAALIIKEDHYDFDELIAQFKNLLGNDELLKEMSENSNRVLLHNAANIIADEILKQI